MRVTVLACEHTMHAPSRPDVSELSVVAGTIASVRSAWTRGKEIERGESSDQSEASSINKALSFAAPCIELMSSHILKNGFPCTYIRRTCVVPCRVPCRRLDCSLQPCSWFRRQVRRTTPWLQGPHAEVRHHVPPKMLDRQDTPTRRKYQLLGDMDSGGFKIGNTACHGSRVMRGAVASNAPPRPHVVADTTAIGTCRGRVYGRGVALAASSERARWFTDKPSLIDNEY